ncbi:MAG TPA: S8 family serine peptidase [Xanthomonadaceae bacterium]|nr:S8 family serine peptidase [Xanthomonadaceae bacterium]
MHRLHCSSLRFALMLALLAAQGPALAARLDPGLPDRLAGLDVAGAVEVIVTFEGEGPPDGQDLALLSGLGLKGITLRGLPVAGVLATGGQVQALLASGQVRSVWFNAPLQYEGGGAASTADVKQAHTGSPVHGRGMPYSGRGVGVLVNDSGVDGKHRDLRYPEHVVQNVAGRVDLHAATALGPVSYTEDVADTDQAGGHGTLVAGIVGGTGHVSDRGRFKGVAPGADIIGYGSGPGLSTLDALGGFDYALTHQFEYNIRVIAGSFGNSADTGTPFDPDDPVNVATKALADRGVVVVFPAGNAGSAEATITGNFKKAPWVVTVGAGDNGGGLSVYSSRGSNGNRGRVQVGGEVYHWVDRPTVTAPEASADPGRVGTSMAAPHVSGIVALMLEANPALSWREVKRILQETATRIPGRTAWEAGAGHANAHAAVQAALGAGDPGATVHLNRRLDGRAAGPSTAGDRSGTGSTHVRGSGPVRTETGDG